LSDFSPEILEGLIGADAAWHLPERPGWLHATGGDRARFLDGLLTGPVSSLEPGQCAESLLLDRKGHVLSTLDVCVHADAIDLAVAATRAPVVYEVLDRHLVADDVELEDRSEGSAELVVWGAGAERVLGRVGLDVPGVGSCVTSDGLLLARSGSRGVRRIRVFGPSDRVKTLSEQIDVPQLDTEQCEAVRIASFEPAYGPELGDRTFPQEARLDASVDFDKGCYLGQETVQRIHSRGGVNKLLVQIVSGAPLRDGAPIAADGREVGRVTSAATTPAGELALGYVKVAAAAPGTALTSGDASAVVLGPPLDDARPGA
jgi:aminomethyltransferase